MNDIPSDWGTAVNVQSMVFGNMGDTSGTGVAFTRNPSTGEKKLYGEYLMNAQGEDVVAEVFPLITRVFSASLTISSWQPATQQAPIPRATTAACEVIRKTQSPKQIVANAKS